MTELTSKLRRLFLIKVGFWVVLLIFGILFLLWPQYAKTKNLADAVDLLYGENQQLQLGTLSSGNSGAKLQEIREELFRHRRMIPQRSELAVVLDKIAQRAQGDGLEVLSLKPVRDQPLLKGPSEMILTDSYQVFQMLIQMNAKGEFKHLGRYLDHLENGPYKIMVHSLDLKTGLPPSSDEPAPPALEINLTLAVLMKFPHEEMTV